MLLSFSHWVLFPPNPQVSVQDELVQVQPKFKSNLLESVEVFREDVMNFAEAYEMVI